MAYTRLHWVESETPLSADNMNNIEDGIEELKSQKVDKVSGKALSDQNYTAAEKTKLAGIEAGAEVNVQSDWNQTNTSADDFIQNKPVNATTSTAGFMSASDKSKLDGVQAGAQVNPGAATTSAAGLMSAADKTKLNGIATGAEVNQNAFSNVKVGSTTVSADGKTDTLELVAGSNVTLTPDATNDKVTIAATDTKYNAATTSAAGLMSAADKTKLNGIAAGATKNTAVATTSANGLMSASDKSKLNGIEPGAEVNLGISIQGEAVNEDALELQFDGFMVVHAGYGTPGAITRRTTISLPAASASNNGYMSKEDKAKLNGIEFAKITATLDSTVTIAAGKHTYITYKNDSIGNYKAIIPLRIPATDGLLLRGFRTIDAGFSVALSNITDSTKTVTSEAALLLGINY